MLSEEHQKMAQKVFDSAPFVQHLGMKLIELTDGEATLEMEMRDELRQPHGLLHGGATASLIDTATAFANVTAMKEDEKAATVDLTVHFLRPVVSGKVTCKAKIVKAGRRLSTITADVYDNEKKIVATAITTYAKV